MLGGEKGEIVDGRSQMKRYIYRVCRRPKLKRIITVDFLNIQNKL